MIFFRTTPCHFQNECVVKENRAFNFEKECKICPLECDSIYFNTNSASRKFNSDVNGYGNHETDYTDAMKHIYNNTKNIAYNLGENSFINRVVHIFMYYEELKYTEVSEIPKMTLGDLISSIGGTLGLFLGVSLLSFIEVLQFLINVCRFLYKKMFYPDIKKKCYK